MATLDIKIDSASLANAFSKKASETDSQFTKFTKDLLDIAHRWVQKEAPRKTGKLKSAVQKVSGSNTGYVFIAKGIAPYADFVIDGTRAHDITPKGKQALFWPGAGHPVKKVHHPGTKSNPFVDNAFNSMQGEINSRVSAFEKWLEDV